MIKDDALELLCFLSPTPAPLRLLSDDLGCSEKRIRDLVTELKSKGFNVRLLDAPSGGFVHVPKDSAIWKKCLGAALDYYYRIYELHPMLTAAGLN